MNIYGKGACTPNVLAAAGMRSRQRGATLVVGLVMLVVLTLLVLSAIRSGNINMRIAGNMQRQEETVAAAQQGIENVISNNNFTTTPPAAQTVDVNSDGAADYTVTFSPAPSCTSAIPVQKTDPGLPPECLGSAGSTYCYWTTWDITGTVTDPGSGASVEVHQGVRMIAGVDAAITFCGV